MDGLYTLFLQPLVWPLRRCLHSHPSEDALKGATEGPQLLCLTSMSHHDPGHFCFSVPAHTLL